MGKQKRNHADSCEVTVPCTEQDLPLEMLRQLIEDNLICEEIPFDLLADQYPSLLEEWYPGYPAAPRAMTEEDPMRLMGNIKNGVVSFKELPDLGSFPLGDVDSSLEGERQVWLRQEKGAWTVHIVMDNELPV